MEESGHLATREGGMANGGAVSGWQCERETPVRTLVSQESTAREMRLKDWVAVGIPLSLLTNRQRKREHDNKLRDGGM